MTPHAVVTGGASGIGAATCAALLDAGWAVTSLDLRPCADSRVRSAVADVTDAAGLTAAIADAAAGGRGIRALVCAAGVSGSALGDGPVDTVRPEVFDTVVGVNLRGAFITVGAAWPHLVAAAGAAVVTVTSVLGLTGGGGPFRSHAYITAKGGLVSFTKAVAAYGQTAGVRANCVAPGVVRTPFARRIDDDPALLAYVAAKQPLTGGPLDPADVGALIAFLVGPHSGAVTGQTIAADGGWRLDAEGWRE
ncbi:SDR family NAD(P)-dependent oxidoreductase [Phytohabitans sp. LJ34]|uniref:SDR family NAD(P)-dependent oxidoreductase n=1 Tax=Phytohabitans sp. LJ34 TaxID=3452217 RepID=UPI003F8903BB